MEAVSVKNTGPSFITTSGKQVHKGWLVTSQTPPPTQLAIEKGSRMKGCQGERCHIALPAWQELSKLVWNPSSQRPGPRKRVPPGAFAGRGVNAVIRDGASAISGLEEGAPL